MSHQKSANNRREERKRLEHSRRARSMNNDSGQAETRRPLERSLRTDQGVMISRPRSSRLNAIPQGFFGNVTFDKVHQISNAGRDPKPPISVPKIQNNLLRQLRKKITSLQRSKHEEEDRLRLGLGKSIFPKHSQSRSSVNSVNISLGDTSIVSEISIVSKGAQRAERSAKRRFIAGLKKKSDAFMKGFQPHTSFVSEGPPEPDLDVIKEEDSNLHSGLVESEDQPRRMNISKMEPENIIHEAPYGINCLTRTGSHQQKQAFLSKLSFGQFKI